MPVLIPPPTKFVGLHCHSGFSVYDGLGYPADHIAPRRLELGQ